MTLYILRLVGVSVDLLVWMIPLRVETSWPSAVYAETTAWYV